MALFGSKLAAIKVHISEAAKELIKKIKLEGKCVVTEIKKYKEIE